MTSVLARASLRYLSSHPIQIALSVIGVALGVAVVVGIDLSSQSARAAFALSQRSLEGRATHEVVGGPGGVPEATYVELRRELGAEIDFAPVVRRTVLAGEGDGTEALELFGIDPFAEGPFRSLRPRRASDTGLGAAAELVAEPGGCLLTDGAAARLGLAVGDALRLTIGARRAEVRLVGRIEAPDEVAEKALAHVLVVDVSTAQELTGRLGVLDRIDVRIADGPAREARVDALSAALGDGLFLRDASARSGELLGMTAAFDLNLRALSLLALIVGVFLVYNAMTFSVVQRRELWGTLRTLGASQGAVFRLVCGEALVLGVVGTAAGLVLGIVLATFLVDLVTRTINDLYFVVSVRELSLDPLVLAKGGALGVFSTLLGAVPPALEAVRTPPRTVQTRSVSETRARAGLGKRALAGGGLGLAALGLILVTDGVAPSYVALFTLLLAAALATPAATVVLCRAGAGLLGPLFGSVGRMAARGVVQNLSRSSVAIAALAIAISAAVGMGVMVESFRSTLVRWMESSLAADVYVGAPSPVTSRTTEVLPEPIFEAAVETEGVAAVSTYRGLELNRPDGSILFGAAMDLHPTSRRAFRFRSSEPDVWERFESGGAAIVSESFGWRQKVRVGDSVRVLAPGGPLEVPIAGVYTDYGSDRGFLVISRATFDRHWDEPGVSSIGFFLEEGVDPEALATELRTRLAPLGEVVVNSNASVREATLIVFDRTFAVTDVLRLLAGAVAFIGVLSALFALQLERAREFGVLRAIGLTPAQLWRLVLAQTGLMGAVAGLIALPLGVALAVLLVFVVNARSFGWTLELVVEPSTLLGGLGLALVSALLAGVVPAWRMSRTPPALALRAD